MAHLSQQTSREVPDLVMAEGGKTTLRAGKRMVHWEGSTTSTVRRILLQRPAITVIMHERQPFVRKSHTLKEVEQTAKQMLLYPKLFLKTGPIGYADWKRIRI